MTPLEPEWEGHVTVTLEFSNTTNLPAKIYASEGVAQMIFFESDEEYEVSYKDREVVNIKVKLASHYLKPCPGLQSSELNNQSLVKKVLEAFQLKKQRNLGISPKWRD